MAKKGKEKGRILAMQLFIKYTQIAEDKDLLFILSKCCAEQKKTADYNLEMVIRKNKLEICQSSCSCPAGTGYSAACKHIGALCFSLEHFSITGKVQELVSCTSESKTWNKPPGRGITHMSIFQINNVEKTNVSQSQAYTDHIINSLINRNIFCNLTNSREVVNLAHDIDHSYTHMHDSVGYVNGIKKTEDKMQIHEFDLQSKPGPSKESVSTDLTAFACREESLNNLDLKHRLEDLMDVILTHSNESVTLKCLPDWSIEKKCCQIIYNKMSNVDIKSVAIESMGNRKLWNKERQFRISGSRCYSLYTYSKENWNDKIQKYFWPKGFSNKAMQYGISTEEEARLCYIKSTGYTVEETGFIIAKKHQWLGYSPDGIIMKDGRPHKLLEIKCPVIGQTKNSAALIVDCDYLQIENHKVILKRKHPYYGQIQLGMAILNLAECDFVVYSKFSNSFANIVTPFDKIFANSLLEKLQRIYFSKMIHQICIAEKEQME
ncbi:uncharacterized protein LOC114327559 [Diabrotica virgifera virgifera]|nr:uncharacterized protein LOC114327559 [Diabrotica virgifera virgifera]